MTNDTEYTRFRTAEKVAVAIGQIDPELDSLLIHESVVRIFENLVPVEDRRHVFTELDECPGQFPGYSTYSIERGNPEWHWKLRRTRNSCTTEQFDRLIGNA